MGILEQLPSDQWRIGDPPTNPDVPPSKPFDDDKDEDDFVAAEQRRAILMGSHAQVPCAA